MEIGDALVQIADKLGITVQQVYELFVSVQAAQGIISIIEIIVFVIGTTFMLKIIWKHKADEYGDNPLVLIGGVCVIIVYGFVLVSLGDAVMQILYPEYYGAKELIESLLRLR